MAIGFTVTGVTDRKIVPDKNFSISSTPRVRLQRFGDGYEQRLAEGINNRVDTFSPTFTNLPKAEIDDILAFFDTQGGITAFNFTYPDTNSTSTATAVVSGAVSNTTAITLTSSTNNLDITVGASITGTNVTTGPAPTVESISGTALVVNTAQNNVSGTLTFTNPNERTVKVICETWSTAYTSSDYYSLQATFRRVYEP
tara:strand:- start:6033 stop:6629 length:597 start_codon:yes stop_codon:yes gene_type:complete